jgi:uncharacterized membrane protein YkoI
MMRCDQAEPEPMRRSSIALAVLACIGVAAPGHAQERRRGHDFEAARQAVESGGALPLAEILARVGGALPGEIVAVEIERQGATWVYEFKVVDGTGRRREIHVDARTGEIRDRERH